MKKVLSIALALVLLLSAITVFVSAEETDPVSKGKSYTVAKMSGDDTYWVNGAGTLDLKDDGVRLTDGKKSSPQGDTLDYTALNGLGDASEAAVVTVDLGKATYVDQFKLYICTNLDWGIDLLNFFRVNVSTDGTEFVEAGSIAGEGEAVPDAAGWVPYVQTITLGQSVSARYVQFEIYTNGNFCWVDEVEAYEGAAPAETPAFPYYPKSLWNVFDVSESVTVDGINNGIFQGADSDCGNAFAYLFTYDSENVYVAIVTNYAGIGTADAKGNGVGTNIRLWFRTNDEATVYTHFVDIQFDGDSTPSLLAKKCGQLHANADAVEISTVGIEAEAVAGSDTLFMQAKIPFSVIEGTADFGAFVTVSNGKTDEIKNNAIIAPYKSDCTFAKDDIDRTKNNSYFPYTSWNDAALLVKVGGEEDPGEQSEEEPTGGKYAVKTFAGYEKSDVAILIRQEGKTTISDVTGGKDYNYYRVILVDADGYVVDVLEKLGRVPVTITDEDPGHGPEDGRKDLVVIPEGGFAIAIHNDAITADGSVYADLFGENGVKVGDTVTLVGFDANRFAETQPGAPADNISFDVTPAAAPAEGSEEESTAPVEESQVAPEESQAAPADNSVEEQSQAAPVEESKPAEQSKDNAPKAGDAGIIALAVVSVFAIGTVAVVKKSK